jgi:hypothetical protein
MSASKCSRRNSALGHISLGELCRALGVDQQYFERDWLALDPVDRGVAAAIGRLLSDGHPVGLATNFCRRLLGVLMESVPELSKLSVCCSSDVGLVKPSIEFFSRASTIMPAKETVFVDDRIRTSKRRGVSAGPRFTPRQGGSRALKRFISAESWEPGLTVCRRVFRLSAPRILETLAVAVFPARRLL